MFEKYFSEYLKKIFCKTKLSVSIKIGVLEIIEKDLLR